MEETRLNALEKELGINFTNKGLLRTALTHDSYLNEHLGSGLESNERLEFLGDSVVRLAVSEHIYPAVKGNEKELHNERERFVTGPTLARISESLGLGRYLFISKGMKPTEEGVLEDAYEAVTAAIFLDKGYRIAADFVNRTLLGAKTQADSIVR